MAELVVKGNLNSAANHPMQISDLFHTPERYYRSVQLERDFDNVQALEQYVVTPPMKRSFKRVLDSLSPDSSRRAWRITGDYGVGKSSFALVLAHILRNPKAPILSKTYEALGLSPETSIIPSLIPILVTGSRTSLVRSIGASLLLTLQLLCAEHPSCAPLRSLCKRAEDGVDALDAEGLVDLLTDLRKLSASIARDGVLLIVDELGKYLEFAASHPEQSDIFGLQRLAEAADRSGKRPFLLLGILHQGMHAYAERLPAEARNEWEKVGGRFEEIVFDQPLEHATALIRDALHIQVDAIPDSAKMKSPIQADSAEQLLWTGRKEHFTREEFLSLYPLHPILIPVIVRFFARFGQNERSLFNFLLSSEPYALQDFASRPITPTSWYRVSNFYDYVRAVFGHRLAGRSYKSHWARVVETLDSLDGLDQLQLDILKTVAVYNLIDKESIIVGDDLITAAISDSSPREKTLAAIAALRSRGILFERGSIGGYRFWPHTSVNLETAYERAQRALGPMGPVSSNSLQSYISDTALLARRHAIETGTLRHFKVELVDAQNLSTVNLDESGADGRVVVALCETDADRSQALIDATSENFARSSETIIGVTRPLSGLASDLHELRCWQWVADHTAELTDDTYAAAEVARQLSSARRNLTTRLEDLVSLRILSNDCKLVLFREGKRLDTGNHESLTSVLSNVCDELYSDAPLIKNELLNRHSLSSAAAGARMRLLEHMFTDSRQNLLGLDTKKAPPEKSMYLSVLRAGRVHRQVNDVYTLAEPEGDNDPLRLLPSLQAVVATLQAGSGQRVPVEELVKVLRQRPFGVRMGIIPILIALVFIIHEHKIAVYEDGTYLPSFTESAFLRLVKSPVSFEFQWFEITGVRTAVFEQLAVAFANSTVEKTPELLEVVTPLCVFAAGLPEYTRKSQGLPPSVANVRDSLLSAREPATLLFHDLPVACGLEPFTESSNHDEGRVGEYVTALRDSISELKGAYPQLLSRIKCLVAEALDTTGPRIDRSLLADRASRVSVSVTEGRVRSFALRLADTKLDDDAWAEAIGSTLLSKPPKRWVSMDERRFEDEIANIAATFKRLESFTYLGASGQAARSYRVGITRADGNEAAQVIYPGAGDEPAVTQAVEKLLSFLPDSKEVRVAALAQLLWRELEQPANSSSADSEQVS